jgi:hypothetical protein
MPFTFPGSPSFLPFSPLLSTEWIIIPCVQELGQNNNLHSWHELSTFCLASLSTLQPFSILNVYPWLQLWLAALSTLPQHSQGLVNPSFGLTLPQTINCYHLVTRKYLGVWSQVILAQIPACWHIIWLFCLGYSVSLTFLCKMGIRISLLIIRNWRIYYPQKSTYNKSTWSKCNRCSIIITPLSLAWVSKGISSS